MAENKKNLDIFSFWEKVWDDGSKTFSGAVDPEKLGKLNEAVKAAAKNGQKVYLTVGKNRFKKDGEKAPDLRAWIKAPEQAQPARQESYDDVSF